MAWSGNIEKCDFIDVIIAVNVFFLFFLLKIWALPHLTERILKTSVQKFEIL